MWRRLRRGLFLLSEICKFEVKQEIDEFVKDGLSRNQAAKKVAEIFAEALGREVSASTIRDKDLMARKHLAGNPAINSKPQASPQFIESPRITDSGGKREGAGRPASMLPEPRMITEAMQFADLAIDQMGRIRRDDPRKAGALLKVRGEAAKRRAVLRIAAVTGLF